MKTVFFGTPSWAVPSLEALAASPYRPALVVTQPARRRSRGGPPSPSPVGVASGALAIDWIAPESARSAEAIGRLAAEMADLFVVVAYGEILPRTILEMPRLGCVNLHFSLLPRYRGAAPVQWAIANGETETGVTTMRLVPKLDAGPIYLQEKVPIEPAEHAPALGARLAAVGAPLLLVTLGKIEDGSSRAREQDPREATYARLLAPADGWIDWSSPAEAIARRVSGFDPWPGQAATCRTGRIRILEARPATSGKSRARQAPEPGLVLGARGEVCLIACASESVLEAAMVRPEGKRTMTGGEALRGRHLVEGERLGGPDEPRA